MLVGATEQFNISDLTVTDEAAAALGTLAGELVPALRGLPISDAWAGVRPSTPDGLPLLGPCSVEGLIAATGHYRNVILLAPITAAIVEELVFGRTPSALVADFGPERFRSTPHADAASGNNQSISA